MPDEILPSQVAPAVMPGMTLAPDAPMPEGPVPAPVQETPAPAPAPEVAATNAAPTPALSITLAGGNGMSAAEIAVIFAGQPAVRDALIAALTKAGTLAPDAPKTPCLNCGDC